MLYILCPDFCLLVELYSLQDVLIEFAFEAIWRIFHLDSKNKIESSLFLLVEIKYVKYMFSKTSLSIKIRQNCMYWYSDELVDILYFSLSFLQLKYMYLSGWPFNAQFFAMVINIFYEWPCLRNVHASQSLWSSGTLMNCTDICRIRVSDAIILEEGPVCFGCAFLWQKHLFSAPQGIRKVSALSSLAGVTT